MSRWNFGELTKLAACQVLPEAQNPMIDMQPSQGWLTFGCEWACPDTCERETRSMRQSLPVR